VLPPPTVSAPEAARQSVLAWLQSRDERGVRHPEPSRLVRTPCGLVSACLAFAVSSAPDLMYVRRGH
jgi:hypothetical protein